MGRFETPAALRYSLSFLPPRDGAHDVGQPELPKIVPNNSVSGCPQLHATGQERVLTKALTDHYASIGDGCVSSAGSRRWRHFS
jgi:hypothetical protein